MVERLLCRVPIDIAKEFGSTALKHYEAEINQLVRALGGGR